MAWNPGAAAGITGTQYWLSDPRSAVGCASQLREMAGELAGEKLTSADGGRCAPTIDLSAATVLAQTVPFHATPVGSAGGELQLVLAAHRGTRGNRSGGVALL